MIDAQTEVVPDAEPLEGSAALLRQQRQCLAIADDRRRLRYEGLALADDGRPACCQNVADPVHPGAVGKRDDDVPLFYLLYLN